jgi:hypothetical protein
MAGLKPELESVNKAIFDAITKHAMRHQAREVNEISEREIKKAMKSEAVKAAIREHICDENISLTDKNN